MMNSNQPVPKYKVGDMVWCLQKYHDTTSVQEANEVELVAVLFDTEVGDKVHYVCKKCTSTGNLFIVLQEDEVFSTKQAAEKHSEQLFKEYLRKTQVMRGWH